MYQRGDCIGDSVNVTDSPLFIKTLQCAESLARRYLVPHRELTEWWRTFVDSLPEGDARDKAVQQLYASHEYGRVPDPRLGLPGSRSEDPFAAQQQAETRYVTACFNATLEIARDDFLFPQQAVLVYKALDCTRTVINRANLWDETIEDRVKHWVLELLYPDAITFQRSPLHIHISIPLATMPKKAPSKLWGRVLALRDGGASYDTDHISLVSERNELVTSSLWRKHRLLGEEEPRGRKELNRVSMGLKRHAEIWSEQYPDDDDDDNARFRAAFRAAMPPHIAEQIAPK